MYVKNLHNNTTLLNRVAHNIWVCLFMFMFRCVTLKHLNTCSLTTIDSFSCIGGLGVTPLTAVPEVPSSIPGSNKGAHVCFPVLLMFRFYSSILFVPSFVMKWFHCSLNVISIRIHVQRKM